VYKFPKKEIFRFVLCKTKGGKKPNITGRGGGGRKKKKGKKGGGGGGGGEVYQVSEKRNFQYRFG